MKYRFLSVLAWCYLSFVLYALDLSSIKQPLNELGVTLDYSLATKFPKERKPSQVYNYLYSSHITFNGPVSQITDGQLWQLALDAYSFLEADMNQYGISIKKQKPGAMTVIAWGNEIIFASSQKGISFTYEGDQTEVSLSLERCQTQYLESQPDGQATRHRTGGKCGEEMAAHLYYLLPATKASGAKLYAQNAVIGTVVVRGNNGLALKTDPCQGETIVSQNIFAVSVFPLLMLMKTEASMGMQSIY